MCGIFEQGETPNHSDWLDFFIQWHCWKMVNKQSCSVLKQEMLCVCQYMCVCVSLCDTKQLYFKAMRKNSIIDRTWHLEDEYRQQQCENHFNPVKYEGNFDHRVIIVNLEAPFYQNLCDNMSAVATDNKASVPLSLCRHEVMEWVWTVLVCCHFWNPSSIF